MNLVLLKNKPTFFRSIFFLLCATALYLTSTIATASEEGLDTTTFVNASDYSIFLNAIAATDSDHLYNEAMSSDPLTPSIIRTGSAGNYDYSVIEGREKAPIYYLSYFDKKIYNNWIQKNQTLEQDESDPFFASNKTSFQRPIPPSLSMFPPAVVPLAENSMAEVASIGTTALLTILLGEVRMRASENRRLPAIEEEAAASTALLREQAMTRNEANIRNRENLIATKRTNSSRFIKKPSFSIGETFTAATYHHIRPQRSNRKRRSDYISHILSKGCGIINNSIFSLKDKISPEAAPQEEAHPLLPKDISQKNYGGTSSV